MGVRTCISYSDEYRGVKMFYHDFLNLTETSIVGTVVCFK